MPQSLPRSMSSTATDSHAPSSGGETEASGHLSKLADINSKELIVSKTPVPRSLPADLSTLRFGALFSDHMLQVTWGASRGWSAPVIKPLAPLSLHPGSQVLHYGMGCFEGMKAFRCPSDNSIRLFRPDLNMDRLLLSTQRLNLPAFSKPDLLACIKALLKADASWIPAQEGYSIYIRPALMATTPFLGVGPPSDALLLCLLSPVGPYFPTGLRPIRLFVDMENVRAYPGGVGDRKVAGNYAPTIVPQVAAAQKGCSQVLYVLKDRELSSSSSPDGLVGESGAMNLFFLFDDPSAKGGMELVTPPLDGLILPGVTRRSILELVRGWGEIEVSERPLRLSELESTHKEGRIKEVFGTGTAVMIQPVSGLVKQDGSEMEIPFDDVACSHWTNKPPGTSSMQKSPADVDAAEPFSLVGRLYRSLQDIQYGHVEHEWSVKV